VRLATPPALERPVAAAVGVAVGLLNGATTIPGPLFAMFLSGLNLPKRTFVYVVTSTFLVGQVVQFAGYVHYGLYSGGLALASLGLIAPFLLGQSAGVRLQERLDERTFRRMVLAIVATSATYLLLKGLGWF
jgi:uncharacterized membrane protein YfcA